MAGLIEGQKARVVGTLRTKERDGSGRPKPLEGLMIPTADLIVASDNYLFMLLDVHSGRASTLSFLFLTFMQLVHSGPPWISVNL